jgi:adenylate cyclase class 2
MNEVEVKILEVDREKVIDRLLKLGAKKIFDDIMHIVRYDTPDKKLEKEGKLLRLRTEGKKSVITVKETVSDEKAKVRNETEIQVPDFEDASKILEKIGFIKTFIMEKRRITYALEDAHFEFDKFLNGLEKVPELLEIEAEDTETVFKYVKLLGFKEKDALPWSTGKVLEHYRLK